MDAITFYVITTMAAFFPVVCAIAGLMVARSRTHGGLHFWRLGRIGGSVYIVR